MNRSTLAFFLVVGAMAVAATLNIVVGVTQDVPDLRRIMRELHAPKVGLVPRTAALMEQGTDGGEMRRLAALCIKWVEQAGKNPAPRGDIVEWDGRVREYVEDVKSFAENARDGNPPLALKRLRSLEESCAGCHRQFRD